jgi:hypothetical protein
MDRQTDMIKLIDNSHNFANAPKNDSEPANNFSPHVELIHSILCPSKLSATNFGKMSIISWTRSPDIGVLPVCIV